MENTLAEIQKLVKEIDSYTVSYSSLSTVPTIELDILRQKTSTLYDLLTQVKNSPEETPSKVEEVVEEQTEQPKTEEIQTVEEVTEPISEPEGKEEEVPQEPEILFEVDEKQLETPTEPQKAETPEPERKQEIFAPKQAADLGSKLGMTPIKEIMSAIGINDRFRFRLELFNKDQELFVRTVGILNDCKSFSDALAYLQKNFDWDYEKKEVEEFLQIVERRFL